MPKLLPQDVNLRILAEVASHPGGIGIESLQAGLGQVVSRRTLQRRLSDLALQGLLSAQGRGRGRLYASISTDEPPAATAGTSVRDLDPAGLEAPIPLSVESNELLTEIRRPIQHRTPAGYDRSFLEAYQPNETFYLNEGARADLLEMGRSPATGETVGIYTREMVDRLLIDLSWASSRLERSTYTRLETKGLIEVAQEAERKAPLEAQMILNHKVAIEFLIGEAEDLGFDAFTFFNLQALLSDNLLSDPSEGGRLRTRIVEIAGTAFRPLNLSQQIEQCFELMLEKADLICDPFEQAFFVMVHIPYLRPFVDANKRVSRIAANLPLIKHNLCPLSFVDVPQTTYVEATLAVYELRCLELLRDVFVWAYERSCRQNASLRDTAAEPDPFRLRHRESLANVVNEIVRHKRWPTKTVIRAAARLSITDPDLNQFVELAYSDLQNLHEGNVSRYRLRLAEYQEWQSLRVPPEATPATVN